jgi:hypothetical protein
MIRMDLTYDMMRYGTELCRVSSLLRFSGHFQKTVQTSYSRIVREWTETKRHILQYIAAKN